MKILCGKQNIFKFLKFTSKIQIFHVKNNKEERALSQSFEIFICSMITTSSYSHYFLALLINRFQKKN